jgi:hypothetical protein
MGILNEIIKSFNEADQCIQHISPERKLEERKKIYKARYWNVALVVWEIIQANASLMKILPQKEPKWLQPPQYFIRDENNFDFILYRVHTNVPQCDGAVTRHEIVKIIKRYLQQCDFGNFDVDCTENVYNYFVTIRGFDGGIQMGKPMSNKIGVLFVNQFSDYLVNSIITAFDIKFFDGSNYGFIRDNIVLSLYHAGQFLKTSTTRDFMGNPNLSRLPIEPKTDFNYLVLT